MLTRFQAYAAMFDFLDSYYKVTRSEAIGGLLGSMSVLKDGSPADCAFSQEWNQACDRALEGKVQMGFQIED